MNKLVEYLLRPKPLFLVTGRAFRDPIEPMNKKPSLDIRDTLADNLRTYTVKLSDSESHVAIF